MMISLFDRVENTVGKGENAGYQHFLLFPQYFPKPPFLGSLKVGIVWIRYKILEWSKLKALADDIVKMAEIAVFFVVDRENLVGKGENASKSFFHNVLNKLLLKGH